MQQMLQMPWDIILGHLVILAVWNMIFEHSGTKNGGVGLKMDFLLPIVGKLKKIYIMSSASTLLLF